MSKHIYNTGAAGVGHVRARFGGGLVVLWSRSRSAAGPAKAGQGAAAAGAAAAAAASGSSSPSRMRDAASRRR